MSHQCLHISCINPFIIFPHPLCLLFTLCLLPFSWVVSENIAQSVLNPQSSLSLFFEYHDFRHSSAYMTLHSICKDRILVASTFAWGHIIFVFPIQVHFTEHKAPLHSSSVLGIIKLVSLLWLLSVCPCASYFPYTHRYLNSHVYCGAITLGKV